MISHDFPRCFNDFTWLVPLSVRPKKRPGPSAPTVSDSVGRSLSEAPGLPKMGLLGKTVSEFGKIYNQHQNILKLRISCLNYHYLPLPTIHKNSFTQPGNQMMTKEFKGFQMRSNALATRLSMDF